MFSGFFVTYPKKNPQDAGLSIKNLLEFIPE